MYPAIKISVCSTTLFLCISLFSMPVVAQKVYYRDINDVSVPRAHELGQVQIPRHYEIQNNATEQNQKNKNSNMYASYQKSQSHKSNGSHQFSGKDEKDSPNRASDSSLDYQTYLKKRRAQQLQRRKIRQNN